MMRSPPHGIAVAMIFGCALALTGCAFGRHHAYHTANPRVMVRGSVVVALAVQDQRASLTMGKSPDFVGLSRGGFGNTFDIGTVSGQPLAVDFATSIARGLQNAGFRVIPVTVADRVLPEQLRDALFRTGAQRGLVVQIQEWKSDTYQNTALHYSVVLRVLDPAGEELGRTAISGSDNLGGSFWAPAGFAEDNVPPAYAHKLEQLLNDPAVLRALAPAPPRPPLPPAPPPGAPSVIVPSS
jgi:hypothetical protein